MASFETMSKNFIILSLELTQNRLSDSSHDPQTTPFFVLVEDTKRYVASRL